MLPWPVIIVVTFELKFKFTASLLSTLGKKSLVIAPFVISSHWLCHLLMLSFRTSVVYGQPWVVVLAYGGHGGRGVGVTLEVRLHRFVMGENGRGEWGKNPRVGYARRGIRI